MLLLLPHWLAAVIPLAYVVVKAPAWLLRQARLTRDEWRRLRVRSHADRRSGHERRNGIDRRQLNAGHIPERRSGRDRRQGQRRQRDPVLAVVRAA
jgi:hypothetical protein